MSWERQDQRMKFVPLNFQTFNPLVCFCFSESTCRVVDGVLLAGSSGSGRDVHLLQDVLIAKD